MFDFELIDTSLEGEMQGARTDEHDRLVRAGEVLRKRMADSGKFDIVDIAPVPRTRMAAICRPAAAAT